MHNPKTELHCNSRVNCAATIVSHNRRPMLTANLAVTSNCSMLKALYWTIVDSPSLRKEHSKSNCQRNNHCSSQSNHHLE